MGAAGQPLWGEVRAAPYLTQLVPAILAAPMNALQDIAEPISQAGVASEKNILLINQMFTNKPNNY